jgi:hypothetical protein
MLTTPLEAVYDPGLHCISPEKVAATLHVSLAELARIADVHRNTLARAPASPKVQARLGEVMRILAEAAELLGDDVGRPRSGSATNHWPALMGKPPKTW